MTTFEIFVSVAALLLALCLLSLKLNRAQCAVLLTGVVFVVLAAWLLAIRQSQLAPHHIITSVNGHVMADHIFTNNEIIGTGWRDEVTSTGIVLVPYPVTNELWHIWGIFK